MKLELTTQINNLTYLRAIDTTQICTIFEKLEIILKGIINTHRMSLETS